MSDAALWRPPHAYIPGQTARHDESLFDFLKADLADCTLAELPHTAAWLHAMAFIEDDYYWEAHEVLEAVWLQCPPNGPEKLYVQSLIQQANAGLKRKAGLDNAADKIQKHSDELLREAAARAGGSVFGGAISL